MQDFCETSHTLDERSGGFIPPAKEIKAVLPPAAADFDYIVREPLCAGESQLAQRGQERLHDITPQGADRLAADGKGGIGKLIKRPGDKG